MGKYRSRFEGFSERLDPKQREQFLAILDSTDLREELFIALQEDAQTSLENLRLDNQNQYLRRTAVRTNLAMVEGLTNCLNQLLLVSYQQGQITLTENEIENITEQKTKKNGGVRPFFLSLGDKIQKSFALFSKKIGGSEFLFDTTSSEWRLLESSIQIRNQIMHPKRIEDFSISDDQIKIITQAPTWFIAQYTFLLKQVTANLHNKNAEIIFKAKQHLQKNVTN